MLISNHCPPVFANQQAGSANRPLHDDSKNQRRLARSQGKENIARIKGRVFCCIAIAILISGGCDLNASKQTGKRVINPETNKQQLTLHGLVRNGAQDRIKTAVDLIDSGVDIDALDRSGVTAAMLATGWSGQYDIACLLLESGADHMVYNRRGDRRLAHMVETEREKRQGKWLPGEEALHAKLVRILEDRGESFDEIRKENEWERLSDFGSPAAKNKFLTDRQAEVTRLKQLGSNFNRKQGLAPAVLLHQFIGEQGQVRLDFLQVMIEEGVDLNQPLLFGETPAMSAVRQRRQFGLALRFLRAGADPSVPRINQRTNKETRLRLVHYVARAANEEPSFSDKQRREYLELVNWLNEHGESVDQAKSESYFWGKPLGD